jgi:transcriptional regulator with XRE-family HTH domain
MDVAKEMGKECENGNQNVYFQARKAASSYSPKLYSREGAAEMLGVSPSTLADYELGITKVVPVDKVVLMSDLYKCPELKNQYCKNECPIGKMKPIAIAPMSIEKVALKLLKELEVSKIQEILRGVVDIAINGDEEKLTEISTSLKEVERAISEFQLIAEKKKL